MFFSKVLFRSDYGLLMLTWSMIVILLLHLNHFIKMIVWTKSLTVGMGLFTTCGFWITAVLLSEMHSALQQLIPSKYNGIVVVCVKLADNKIKISLNKERTEIFQIGIAMFCLLKKYEINHFYASVSFRLLDLLTLSYSC